MQPIASEASHTCRTVSSTSAAQTAMAMLARHLDRRLTQPPPCHSRNSGPKSGWPSKRACKVGELRAAAHAAKITNTVLGMPGTSTPITASTMQSTAIAYNSHRTGAGGKEPGGGRAMRR